MPRETGGQLHARASGTGRTPLQNAILQVPAMQVSGRFRAGCEPLFCKSNASSDRYTLAQKSTYQVII